MTLAGLNSLRQKKCKNSIGFFMILLQKTIFQNIKIKLNSNAWMTLKSFHQKSNCSLISDNLSVGGCWGQPMSFFWKLFDETQISTPPEATRNHTSIKLLIPLPLRADLLISVYSETPFTLKRVQRNCRNKSERIPRVPKFLFLLCWGPMAAIF